MRCDNCPLCPIAEDGVCPECEGKYGIEHADGMLVEMDFTPEELAEVIDLCKHMVGLDYQKPYHRHGKAFYRPYRNYFADGIPGNRLLNKLPHWIITKSQSEKHVYYKLTADGLKWLGRQLGITIKEERD